MGVYRNLNWKTGGCGADQRLHAAGLINAHRKKECKELLLSGDSDRARWLRAGMHTLAHTHTHTHTRTCVRTEV
jgi:hypothetical protein